MYLSQFITEKEKLHITSEQGLIYNECGSRRVLVCLPDFKSGSSSKKARGGFDSHMLPPKMILLTLTSMANNLLYFVGAG